MKIQERDLRRLAHADPDGNVHVIPGWEDDKHEETPKCACHPYRDMSIVGDNVRELWVHQAITSHGSTPGTGN